MDTDSGSSSCNENELVALNSWHYDFDETSCKADFSRCSKESTNAISGDGSVNKKLKLLERFTEAKLKSQAIQQNSAIRRQKTERRRAQRLLKKAMKDPCVKKLVEKGESAEREDSDTLNEDGDQEEWHDIKTFLNVNSHLQGPIPHGDCGPKTELESLVDKCLEEGDFEKAEVLSDTLANRQFAVKIAKAFDAKRYSEELAEQEKLRKAKQMKKLRWGFEPKERWQMKGNM